MPKIISSEEYTRRELVKADSRLRTALYRSLSDYSQITGNREDAKVRVLKIYEEAKNANTW